MRLIQLLGPGCCRCDQLGDHAEAAVRQLGIEATIQKVTDIEEIMEFDVLMTPALVIDGEVKVVGKVVSVEEIKRMLAEGAVSPSPEAGAEGWSD